MSQDPLCPNSSQKVQKEVSQMANRNLSPVILLGGLSVNLNHLKSKFCKIQSMSMQSKHAVCSNARSYELSYINVDTVNRYKLQNRSIRLTLSVQPSRAMQTGITT